MGLNNYTQVAIPLARGLTFFMPEKSGDLTCKQWGVVAMGQHHALCLEEGGAVYSLGRQEYGRLGLGEEGVVGHETEELPDVHHRASLQSGLGLGT